jgi:hypothetical protein
MLRCTHAADTRLNVWVNGADLPVHVRTHMKPLRLADEPAPGPSSYGEARSLALCMHAVPCA